MKIHKAIIDKDENGVYLQLPYGEKQYFTDAREFMNAYYAHEVLRQFYEQDSRIAVLERALLKACIEIGGTSQCGFIYDDLLDRAEKELKDE